MGGEKCNAVSHSNKPVRKSEADGSTFVYGLHWSYIGKAFHCVISWPVSGLMKVKTYFGTWLTWMGFAFINSFIICYEIFNLLF